MEIVENLNLSTIQQNMYDKSDGDLFHKINDSNSI